LDQSSSPIPSFPHVFSLVPAFIAVFIRIQTAKTIVGDYCIIYRLWEEPRVRHYCSIAVFRFLPGEGFLDIPFYFPWTRLG
jgi:hypothetical protein